eukprot:517208_1
MAEMLLDEGVLDGINSTLAMELFQRIMEVLKKNGSDSEDSEDMRCIAAITYHLCLAEEKAKEDTLFGYENRIYVDEEAELYCVNNEEEEPQEEENEETSENEAVKREIDDKEKEEEDEEPQEMNENGPTWVEPLNKENSPTQRGREHDDVSCEEENPQKNANFHPNEANLAQQSKQPIERANRRMNRDGKATSEASDTITRGAKLRNDQDEEEQKKETNELRWNMNTFQPKQNVSHPNESAAKEELCRQTQPLRSQTQLVNDEIDLKKQTRPSAFSHGTSFRLDEEESLIFDPGGLLADSSYHGMIQENEKFTYKKETEKVVTLDVAHSIEHLIEAVETNYGDGAMVDFIEINAGKEATYLHDAMTQNVDFFGAIKFTPNGNILGTCITDKRMDREANLPNA